MTYIIYHYLEYLFNRLDLINKMHKQNIIMDTFISLTYEEQLDIYHRIQDIIIKNESPTYTCLLTEKEIYALSWF